MVKNFHFILQGKGGVGKSTCSSFIAQYLKHYNIDYLAIDTDQVNASFASFKDLNVEALNIMENNQIVARGWDTLIEKCINTDKSNIIIDNGASSFVPLIAYAIENELVELLTSEDNDYTGYIYIHVPIAGAESLTHTIKGLSTICERFPQEKVGIVCWLNYKEGKIEDNGKTFTEMKEYKANKDRIIHIIDIPDYNKDTFGKDLETMLSKNRTFDEMLNSQSVSVASRHRYKKLQKEIFEKIEDINFIFNETE